MSSMPKTERKSDAKYDIIKFILSLMVLAIHSTLCPMLLYPWLRIAVPLFFMMSAYFVFLKLHRSPVEKHKGIIKKFALRNLQLYLSWLVILLPQTLRVRESVWFAGSVWQNLLKILQSFFFDSTFVASWFLAATVFGVIIVYFLSRIIKSDVLLLILCFAAFCIVSLKSSYPSLIENTLFGTALDQYSIVFGDVRFSFPAALFWVFMGKLFAEGKVKIRSVVLLILLTLFSGALLYLEWKFVISFNTTYNNDSYFFLAPFCVFLFALIQKIRPFSWGLSVVLKRASTVIYVVHGSMLPTIRAFVVAHFYIDSNTYTFILTMVNCIIIYFIIEILIKITKALKALPISKLLQGMY